MAMAGTSMFSASHNGSPQEDLSTDFRDRLENLASGQLLLLDGMRRLELALHAAAAGGSSGGLARFAAPSATKISHRLTSRVSNEDNASVAFRGSKENSVTLDLMSSAPSDVSHNSQGHPIPPQQRVLRLRAELSVRASTGESSRFRRYNTRRSFGATDSFTPLSDEDARARARWVLNPMSPTRIAWDTLSLLTLFFDLLTIPVIVAWDLDTTHSWLMIGLAIACVWTVDVILSFRTGFYDETGEVETRLWRIARRYLRSFFILDLGLVANDWASFFLTVSMQEFRWVRFAKANRLLKLIRLLRVTKITQDSRVAKVLNTYFDKSTSAGFRAVMNILELLFVLVYLNHVLACIWFWLGMNAPRDTGHSWLAGTVGGLSETTYMDSAFWFQYFTSLHWSLTQMTPGSMQVVPLNTAERVFNVLCLLLGFVFFGSLISMLSAETAHFRMMRQERTTKLNFLHNYLREKNIGSDLMMQVKGEARERMRIRKPLVASDVSLLGILSARLRTSLNAEACRPFLSRHPFIRSIMAAQPGFIRVLCSGSALEFQVVSPGDLAFEADTPALTAYIVVDGSLRYVPMTPGSIDEDEVEDMQVLGKGTWVAEAALWLQWTYMGTAEALGVTEVLVIRAQELLDSVQETPDALRACKQYSRLYHRFIDDAPCGNDRPLNDVNASSFDRAEFLLAHLPRTLRHPMSRACLSTLHDSLRWGWLKRHQLQDLTAEVDNGLCTLFYNENGEVQRLLRVASMRVVREDGRVLVQVGTWHDSCLQVMCRLPGTALREDEEASDAIARLVSDKLASTPLSLQMGEAEVQMETGESRTFGLKTKYIKIIQTATLKPETTLRMDSLQSSTGSQHKHSWGNSKQSSANFKTSSRTSISYPPGRTISAFAPQTDIVIASNGLRVFLHAWFLPEELAWLSGQRGDRDVLQWLHTIHTPDSIAKQAEAALKNATSLSI